MQPQIRPRNPASTRRATLSGSISAMGPSGREGSHSAWIPARSFGSTYGQSRRSGKPASRLAKA